MATASDDVPAASGRATAASVRATAAGIKATAASDVIQELPDESAIAEPSNAPYENPRIGLLGTESVLRDGSIGRPVVLNGEDISGLQHNELILRGGRLDSPQVLIGLEEVSGKLFFKLQKFNQILCKYLTGISSYQHPLANVTISQDMQTRIDKFCIEFSGKMQSLIDEAGATAEPTEAANAIVGDVRRNGLVRHHGIRSHKKRPMSDMLPESYTVDMTMYGKPWFPRCVITTRWTNVSIEATTENFKTLFEIVNKQLVEVGKVTCTPTRTVRRRKSDPKAPKGSPGRRIYFVKGKGFIECTKTESPTRGTGN